jgi:GNAT superfamily N-acetyltransferase
MPVRPATIADAAYIAEIHVEAWRAAYASLMPAEVLSKLDVERRTAIWRRSLTEPGPGMTVVALDEAGMPTGFCVFGPGRDDDAKGQPVGELVALNIRPTAWRQGHGRALCEWVLRHAPTEGWSSVTLWVLEGNARARRFYETLGFAADGTEKHDSKLVGASLHELRYRMDLESSGNCM